MRCETARRSRAASPSRTPCRRCPSSARSPIWAPRLKTTTSIGPVSASTAATRCLDAVGLGGVQQEAGCGAAFLLDALHQLAETVRVAAPTQNGVIALSRESLADVAADSSAGADDQTHGLHASPPHALRAVLFNAAERRSARRRPGRGEPVSGAKPLARTAQAVGWLMLAAGVSVFAIRLRHAGPYAFPEEGNLRAGVLALGIGIALAAPGIARAAGGAGGSRGGCCSPRRPSSCSSRSTRRSPRSRKWWCCARPMPAAHRRTSDSGSPTTRERPGSRCRARRPSGTRSTARDSSCCAPAQTSCVVPRLSTDPADNERTFRLRDEKYAIQRLGRWIGLFGDGPSAETVTLRLDPCP